MSGGRERGQVEEGEEGRGEEGKVVSTIYDTFLWFARENTGISGNKGSVTGKQ